MVVVVVFVLLLKEGVRGGGVESSIAMTKFCCLLWFRVKILYGSAEGRV